MYCSLRSDRYRFILLWNRKCGCTSLKHWFRYIHARKVYRRDINQWERHNRRRLSIRRRDFVASPYYKFIVCRNPYSRLVSFFCDKFPKGLGFGRSYTFERFIDELIHMNPATLDPHIRPQVIGLDGLRVDRIIRLEELDRGLSEVERLERGISALIGRRRPSDARMMARYG